MVPSSKPTVVDVPFAEAVAASVAPTADTACAGSVATDGGPAGATKVSSGPKVVP